jgi:hypothetical protein
MILEFISPTDSVNVHVDLLDNPGVHAWANKFLTGTYETAVIHHDHLYIRPPDYQHINMLQNQCKILADELAQHGIVYSGADIVPFETSTTEQMHQWLNQLHRFFTHNQQQCNFKQLPTGSDYQLIFRKLEEINYHIHDIELYVPRRSQDLAVDSINEIKLWQNNQTTDSSWVDLESYRQYHSSQYHNVILTSDVLGKTILQSYLDGDNPNHWDTSGHHHSSGGLQICYSNTRQRIYQSKSFQQWLFDHGLRCQDVYYDFPVGNIKDMVSFQQLVNSSAFADVKKVVYRK